MVKNFKAFYNTLQCIPRNNDFPSQSKKLCMSCPLHRDSDVELEFILVDDFFRCPFEVKLRFMEALTEDKRFAESNFQHFEKEELSSLLMNQDRAEDEDEDDDEDDDDAVRNRLVYLLLDAIAN